MHKTPSNFYLFGKQKHKIIGLNFDSVEYLVELISLNYRPFHRLNFHTFSEKKKSIWFIALYGTVITQTTYKSIDNTCTFF